MSEVERFLKAIFPHLGTNGVMLRPDDGPETIWHDGLPLPQVERSLRFSSALVTAGSKDLAPRLYAKRGTDLDAVLLTPFAPTAVVEWRPQYIAFWVTRDEWPANETGPEFYSVPGAELTSRLLSLTPGLVYTRSDVEASWKVAPPLVSVIRGGIAAPDGQSRTRRELAVIHALRQAGVSPTGISQVFDQQPIGDPYREIGSVVGHWTILDALVQDVLDYLDEGKFLAVDDGEGVVWFYLPGVLNWWYRHRHEQALPILPELEMRLLLDAQNIERSPGVGHYMHEACARRVPGAGSIMVRGIDLKAAARIGITRKGKHEEVGNSPVPLEQPGTGDRVA